nr:MAG TPA: hypothetical protein [Bacteriophage sp.]
MTLPYKMYFRSKRRRIILSSISPLSLRNIIILFKLILFCL